MSDNISPQPPTGVTGCPSGNNDTNPPSPARPPLALEGLTKAFYGVKAVDGVDLTLQPGRIHALVGENGAGKSTLINMCTGLLQPDGGRILLKGQPVTLANSTSAARHGVLAVHQESDLFADLSLAENMLLGQGLVRNRLGLIDWRGTYQQAASELAALGETTPARTPAGSLSIGRRVLAEIAAAVARQPAVLFLDEPTASLTLTETRKLFEQLARLKQSGVAIVYVSHRLDEVLEISDTITVLRDGRHVITEAGKAFDIDRLVSLMVGRETDTFFSRTHGQAGEAALEVEGLTCPDRRFSDISLSIHKGEIVGLYGLVGAGRSELGRALTGLDSARGSIRMHGQPLAIANPIQAVEAGLAYLPEDRLTEGIFPNHSCRSNVTSAIVRRLGKWGFIPTGKENAATQQVIDQFRVKLDSPEQPINTLSGGNQQKLVLGRWLQTQPEVLILDEPTRGVDVGAKVEIYKMIDELAAQGKAILMISSELPEIMRMSDRVLVMSEGQLTGEFNPREASEDKVAAAAIPRLKPKDGPESVEETVNLSARLMRFREMGIGLALLVIVVLMSLAKTVEFASLKNLIDVLTSASITSVGAAGMTLVIITGGIDISIGAILGLVGAVAGMAAMAGVPPLVCLAMAVGLGSLIGCVNATLSTLGRVHSIIITLAGISIYRGIMLQATGGYEINPLPDAYRALMDGRLLGMPKVLWFALGVLALNWVLISRTLAGRRLLAVGNSIKAARLIGLAAWRQQLLAFAILGGLVGLASVMWGCYYGKIQSNTGLGWEMQVIAASVIGGCSIMGGRGTALGAFLGSVLIALIYNSLVILKVSAYWQNLFVGSLILGAVLVDIWLPVALEAWQRKRRSA